MPAGPATSEFRVEKRRVEATITLSNGETAQGWFFVAGSGPLSGEPERVGQLLNLEDPFFPFERADGQPDVTLYNRSHVVLVVLSDDEAGRVPGYEVATPRLVSVSLSTGARVIGYVRVYAPGGRDRVSDWARDPRVFRYLETPDATLLINVHHVIDVREHQEAKDE